MEFVLFYSNSLALLFQKASQKNEFASNLMAFILLSLGFILTILYLIQNEFLI